MGVFSKIYLRLWNRDEKDIGKVKKIKVNRRIREIIHSPDKTAVVVYEDGYCEALESALGSRKQQKGKCLENSRDFFIDNPLITSTGILTFIKRVKEEKYFCYTAVDITISSYKPTGVLRSFLIVRPSVQNVKFIGSTVVTSNGDSFFISIWSDKRIFSRSLKTDVSESKDDSRSDFFHSTLEVCGEKDVTLHSISESCIAMYIASNQDECASYFVIYNLRYKIIQSKIPFKVFIPYTRFWIIDKYIFLALGQYLKAIPFLLGEDKISSLVAAQADCSKCSVDNEMMNEDMLYEEALQFDVNQDIVMGMEFIPNNKFWKKRTKNLSGAKGIVGYEEVRDQLENIYREDMMVETVKFNEQPNDTIFSKMFTNVDEAPFMLAENAEYYCRNMEQQGCGELEISDKIIPILIKANRTEDIGLILKRYNHISEKMLVRVIKYILQCPRDDDVFGRDISTADSVRNMELLLTKDADLLRGSRIIKKNMFLCTKQDQNRDVLSIALCSAFHESSILPFIKNEVSLKEIIKLLDHLHTILTTSTLEYEYETRGNLIEGDDFDFDTKMFEWFSLLLDSHYHQILWNRTKDMEQRLAKWLLLIDYHIDMCDEMKNLRPIISKLANNETPQASKSCGHWYTVEKTKLF